MPTTDPVPATGPVPGRGPAPALDPVRADPAGLRARLLTCRDAEDYFDVLEVPFDPQLLGVNRLHVLRLFAAALQEYLGGGGEDDPAATEGLRRALRVAHDTFVTSGALDHRLFKILQDRAPRTFVPLDSVDVEVDVEVVP